MPRIARIVAEGYPHHIIQRGNNRQDIFFDDEDREIYLGLLKKYSVECSCKIKAYCLMNNHVHILIVPQYQDSLAKMMQKLSLTFTQHINKKHKRTGRLWECRFHSCIVDTDSYLWAVAKYIERNPLRANICTEPFLYKWSSAKISVSAESAYTGIEPVWKDYGNRNEYVKFLYEDKETDSEKIRQSIYKGIPFGSKSFVNDLAEKLNFTLNNKGRGRPKNGMCP
ncbi:MAG: transposase [Candidatus Omnitrophota bacterium]|jgi:putative transposase